MSRQFGINKVFLKIFEIIDIYKKHSQVWKVWCRSMSIKLAQIMDVSTYFLTVYNQNKQFFKI